MVKYGEPGRKKKGCQRKVCTSLPVTTSHSTSTQETERPVRDIGPRQLRVSDDQLYAGAQEVINNANSDCHNVPCRTLELNMSSQSASIATLCLVSL